jgi:hypothetical protein
MKELVKEKEDTFTYLINRNYCKFLCYSSISFLLAFIIAYIMDDKYITMYLLFLFLSSINHWRRPEYGIKRNIDLFIVYFGFFAAMLKVCLLKSEFNRWLVLSILICCIVFYIIEFIMVYFNSNLWIILHMTIHMYAAFGMIYMVFD